MDTDSSEKVIKIGTSIPCLGYFVQIEHTVPQSFAKDSNRVGDLLNSVQRNVFLGLGIILGIAISLLMWIFCSDFYGERITTLQTELKTEMSSLKEEVSFERAQFEMMLKSDEGERFVKEIKAQAVNELKEEVTKEAERIISEEKDSIRNQLLSTKGEATAYPEGIKIAKFYYQNVDNQKEHYLNQIQDFITRKDLSIYKINFEEGYVIYKERFNQEAKEEKETTSVKEESTYIETPTAPGSFQISTLKAIGIFVLSSITGAGIVGAVAFLESEMFSDWCKVPLGD